jgi:hypothetical protein
LPEKNDVKVVIVDEVPADDAVLADVVDDAVLADVVDDAVLVDVVDDAVLADDEVIVVDPFTLYQE